MRVRARDRASHDDDVDASENASSGGAADTEMTEVAVKPIRRSPSRSATTATPAGCWRKTSLYCCGDSCGSSWSRSRRSKACNVSAVMRGPPRARARGRGDLGAQGAATLRPPAFDHGVRVGQLRLDQGQRPRGHHGAELDEEGPQVHLADERVRGVAGDDDGDRDHAAEPAGSVQVEERLQQAGVRGLVDGGRDDEHGGLGDRAQRGVGGRVRVGQDLGGELCELDGLDRLRGAEEPCGLLPDVHRGGGGARARPWVARQHHHSRSGVLRRRLLAHGGVLDLGSHEPAARSARVRCTGYNNNPDLTRGFSRLSCMADE